MKAIWTTQQPAGMHLVPDSAVIWRGNPWFVPADDCHGQPWQVHVGIAAVIDRLGTHIPPQFAHRYFAKVAVVAHPGNAGSDHADAEWLRDGALAVGPDIDAAALGDSITVTLRTKDGRTETVQVDTAALMQRLREAIVHVSRFVTVKTGDLVVIDSMLAPVQVAEGTDFTVALADNDRALVFKTR